MHGRRIVTCRNVFAVLARAHPLVWLALAVCAAVATLFSSMALMSDATRGLEYETLINVNLFGYQVVPPYLLLLCFGSVRYAALERVRADPSRTLGVNLRWMALSAVLAVLPLLATYGVVEFVVERRPCDRNALIVAAVAAVQMVMELALIGLTANLVVNCGVPWGYAAPPFMVMFGLSGWLFSTWNQWVGEALFFFLEPLADAGSLIRDKAPAFLGLVATLTVANLVACQRTDHRGR